MKTMLRKLHLKIRRSRQRQRGVAMVMAVTTLGLLAYLAMEVMYDSTVEYTVHAQSLNRLKAYYAARSGLEVGLLRVKIYQEVVKKMGNNQALAGISDYVDEIWRFPFTWPLMLPDELNAVDKEMAEDQAKESLMDASFAVTIQDEGSKIDLNDLVSPSKVLRETTRTRLIEIFQRKIDEDEVWRRAYGNTRFDELVDNITDWMTDKNSGVRGGDKRSLYGDLNRESPDAFPPNRGFRTVGELRLVAGMNDDFFDLLAPQITIYGMRGVNPNVATKEIIMSLDRGITSEVADEIIKRRSDPNLGGPFKNADEFWDFASQRGARFENANYRQIPLFFESLTTFRIKATGEYGGTVRQVEVITVNLDRVAARIKEFMDKEKQTSEDGSSSGDDSTKTSSPRPGGSTASTTSGNNPSKGPPRIVYWTEQ